MTTIEARDQGGELAGGAGIPVGRRARRRDEFEVLGFLLGVLAILLAVAMSAGAAPPA